MRLQIVDYEHKYQEQVASGFAIDITESVSVNNKRELVRHPNGIFSTKFGGEMSDIDELQRKYMCQCKVDPIVGKFMEGTLCPKCNSTVAYIDNDLDKMGWITLNPPFYVISLQMFPILQKLFKPRNLDNMIKYDKKLDKLKFENKTVVAKYFNIGLLEFKNRFLEIMEHCANKELILEYNMVMQNLDKIFTRRIPVLTYLLRPAVMIDGKTFQSENMNKLYSTTVNYAAQLNNVILDGRMHHGMLLSLLYDLQASINEIRLESLRTKLSGKKKKIRKDTLGSRVNFSSRSVLTPLTKDLPMNSIVIPYNTFVELYKFEIMNIYMRVNNYTMIELMNKWEYLVETKDPYILQIVEYLIHNTRGGMRVLLNRPPTLALGSILCLKIVGVNEDFEDLTISVALNVLKLMNADFDGDTLTLIAIKDRLSADIFEAYFSPLFMFISLDKGNFNSYMMLIKGQLPSLYSFCND